ncbi:hypothetical protein CHELA1G11_10991 [Hyphomicrobiales bacterium]|nr:hypothetical protein CHELA1G11_10991 [Hyphomicrobiales bacterium]CAH1670891.1 hypothetical protein CHELA1G2_13318 [Hyphomicrobiales bacterium]
MIGIPEQATEFQPPAAGVGFTASHNPFDGARFGDQILAITAGSIRSKQHMRCRHARRFGSRKLGPPNGNPI